VRAGLRRSETEYVWPTALVPPPESVRLIYLDLNHWIGLAKAAVGHRDGDRHRDALEAVREAKRSGSYTFPLSAEHYMEMSGIAHPRQRFDVAAVMEELSEFASLVSRTIVMRLEVEAAVDALARPRPQPYAAVPVLCQGVLQAFGMSRRRSDASGGAGLSSSTRGKRTQSVNSTAPFCAAPRMLRRRSYERSGGTRRRRAEVRTNAPHRNVSRLIGSRPNHGGDVGGSAT
jgi:hypothetical protein